MKNMKFEVNGNLDEIVSTLESKGYRSNSPPFRFGCYEVSFVVACSSGSIHLNPKSQDSTCFDFCKLTTLAELKEM